MLIYFSIIIFKRNSESFLREGNGSILRSGKQARKSKRSATASKSVILGNSLAADDKPITEAGLQLLDVTVQLQSHPFIFY